VNMTDSGNTAAIQALAQITLAIAALNKTMSMVFPQGELITSSAGSSSGKYLTVTGTDGNIYKIALLNPS
jgi:hypothetical protein